MSERVKDYKNMITPAGEQELLAEYKALKNSERPAVVKAVSWAASNGDRSENADYQYNKRRLREIDRRLEFLNRRLEQVIIIDVTKVNSERIEFGATVS